MPTVRLIWTGVRLNLKTLSRAGFFVFIAIIQPLVFAALCVVMWRSADAYQNDTVLTSLALGSGLLGMWSTTLYGSCSAIRYQRATGTLELLVIAPSPYFVVLLSQTLATTLVGAYGVAATVVAAKLFAVPISVKQPASAAAALVATVVALALLGLLIAAVMVPFRQVSLFATVLEYPLWMASGVLIPIDALPDPVGWVSWPLAPAWGVRALHGAVAGTGFAFELGVCIGLCLVYLLAGAALVKAFERRARQRGTLGVLA